MKRALHCRGLGCHILSTQSFGLFRSLDPGTASQSHSAAEKIQRSISQSETNSWLFQSLHGSRTLPNVKGCRFHKLGELNYMTNVMCNANTCRFPFFPPQSTEQGMSKYLKSNVESYSCSSKPCTSHSRQGELKMFWVSIQWLKTPPHIAYMKQIAQGEPHCNCC